MKKVLASSLAALGALVVFGWVYVGAVCAQRPPTPPSGSPIRYPWGSMHVDGGAQSQLFLRGSMLAARYGIDFDPAAISDEPFFDLEVMRRVDEFGYEQATGGFEWAKLPSDRRFRIPMIEDAAEAEAAGGAPSGRATPDGPTSRRPPPPRAGVP